MNSELEMFRGFTRISKYIEECTPIRGHPDITVYEYPYRVDINFTLQSLFIPVHLPTHLDIAMGPLDRISDPYKKRRYYNPQVFRAYVLNFSHKADALREYLMNTKEGIFKRTWPYLRMECINDENVMWRILRNLEITRKEVEGMIHGKNLNLRDSFIILRTDWFSNFAKTKSNLNDAMMEMFHAYLCHPYIGEDVVNFFLENGVIGIGTDSPDLENPISFTDHKNVLPAVNKVRSIAIREGMLTDDGSYERVVHNKFLQTPSKSRKYVARYLLECLCRLRSIQNDWKVTSGLLMIIQFQTLLYHYGVICEAFFKKERESHD